jgi:hypothetical protein
MTFDVYVLGGTMSLLTCSYCKGILGAVQGKGRAETLFETKAFVKEQRGLHGCRAVKQQGRHDQKDRNAQESPDSQRLYDVEGSKSLADKAQESDKTGCGEDLGREVEG